MKASEFDKKVDEGESVLDELDLSHGRRPGKEMIKRINIDLPVWMIDEIDHEARRLGVTRQSVIKMWLAERLEQKTKKIS